MEGEAVVGVVTGSDISRGDIMACLFRPVEAGRPGSGRADRPVRIQPPETDAAAAGLGTGPLPGPRAEGRALNGYGWDIALIAALIVLNALFAGTEIALVSLRQSQLRRLRRKDGSAAAARLVRLTDDPNRYLATIQIGITLAGFLASATAAVSLAEPLVPLLAFAGRAAAPLAVALVTALLTFVTLVVGELAPKRLAMQYPQRWSLIAATPLNALATLARPVVWSLGETTNLLVRLLGGDPKAGSQPPTPEELRDMVVSHRGLTPEQRTIISSALEIHERTLRVALVPRRAVFTLSSEVSAARARTELARAGHSRAPVVTAAGFEEVVGVVHIKDVTTSEDDTPVGDLARPATVFTEYMKVTEALRRFQADRQQFALVTDEHGSVEGIVTLEDLLAEIVGEIYDETVRDSQDVIPQPDGSWLAPGSFPVRGLPDLGIDPSDLGEAGPYTTVAGLVLHRLGRLPEPGSAVGVGRWAVEVTAVDKDVIEEVRIRPAAGGEPPDRKPSAGRRNGDATTG
ncbi:hemolysin family protein [Streptomyces globosus]|uniref:hemolysin family protein n=1 Tax=Streptomyces globosus TaxID=68209 RepID=UPI001C1FCA20|nr:hemolysin family protein [Streptomyces globosus]